MSCRDFLKNQVKNQDQSIALVAFSTASAVSSALATGVSRTCSREGLNWSLMNMGK
jgi:hypothetical protein